MFCWFHRNRPSSVFVIQDHEGFGLMRETHSDPIDVATDAFARHTHRQGESLHTTISLKRLFLAFYFFLFIFTLFFLRAGYIQLYRGTYFNHLANANRYRITRIVPPRGIITDRNGEALAKNIPSFLLTMIIADLPTEETKRDALFSSISELTGLQRADIDLRLTEYAKRKTEEIPLLRRLSYESAMRLALSIQDVPGFYLRSSTQRSYPSATLSLSHVLGYTGKISANEIEELLPKGYRPIDVIGKTGIEKNAELRLRGTPGEQIAEVDASGDILSIVSKKDPVAGADIMLGIDLKFQKFLETRLKEALHAVNATRGSIVAMDPETGVIRAIVSEPSFDNNLFALGIEEQTYQSLIEDPDHPLFFRAIAGEYPSGSIFKPFVAYAALAENVVSEHTSFLSSGGLRIGDWFFPDWKEGGHGVTDIRKAIAESVNTYFYIVGGGFDQTTGLGVDRITTYARMFGFGESTHIDLPGESDGFLPSKIWKEEVKGERWYVGDTYHLAIGQGDFLTTPIQMAAATSILANGGFRVRPHVIESSDPQKEPLKKLDETALRIVREGMRQGVTDGSSRRLSNLPVSVAGKTGTAQSSGSKPTHSWFIGFAPFENPELVITVLIEEGGESTAAAVPVAYDAFAWWFRFKSTY